jgi:hypothetical protein
MLRPEVLVGRAHEKFDHAGQLTDPATIGFVSEFLTRFATWVERQARL